MKHNLEKKYVLVTLGSGVSFSEYAYIIVVDIESSQIVDTYEAKHQVYESSTKGFTGAHISQDELFVTTEAELLSFSVNPLKLKKRETFTFLNDVHGVYFDSTQKKIFVCNTGLDSVEVFNNKLTHVDSINLTCNKKYFAKFIKNLFIDKPRRKLRDCLLKLSKLAPQNNNDLWTEDIRYKHLIQGKFIYNFYKFFIPQKLYEVDKDLRFVLFRPHILHPNFIEKLDNDYLVTLKNTGEVVSLKDKQTILKDLKAPHDGIIKNSCFLITQAGSGFLSYSDKIFTINDLKQCRLKDIQVCNPDEGFIRGVDMLSESKVVVAISKRREISDDRPAYLAIIDLNKEKIIKTINIPQYYGTNPFTVINVSNYYK